MTMVAGLPLSSNGWIVFPPYEKQTVETHDVLRPPIWSDNTATPGWTSFAPFPTAHEQENGEAPKHTQSYEQTFRSVDKPDSDVGHDKVVDEISEAPNLVHDLEANEVKVYFSSSEGDFEEESQHSEERATLKITRTESTLDLEESSTSSTGVAVAEANQRMLSDRESYRAGPSDSSLAKTTVKKLANNAEDDVANTIELDAVCAAAGECLDRSWSHVKRRSSLPHSQPCLERPESFDPQRFL